MSATVLKGDSDMEQMNRHDGMPTAAKRKRIPYGLMNFVTLRERDCYYVDKTRFIESIEEANMFFFFIRPRRFGKSLTISMLQNYYDINKKEQFDKLFGGLYIGENPTPERNSYLVLPLNFATVDAGLDNYRAGLDSCVNIGIMNFCDRYKAYLPDDIVVRMKEECQGCVDQLKFLAAECENVNQHIYLFIDEYDHFTNKILAEPKHMVRYREQTHGEGYLRMFFDAVKDATSSSLARVFVTGVSPVTMDDLTSGFNIGTNYSLCHEFNELVGFTEEEVRALLTDYAAVCPFNHTVEELVRNMKPWFDNYCFSVEEYGKTTMYNSVMVLNFLDRYIRSGYQIPKSMIETNIRIDYDKIRMLIRHDKNFDHDASIIQELVTKGYVMGNLVENFPAERINDPDNFLSLLFYFGLVTIDGSYQGYTRFIIPNEVVREVFYKDYI